MLVLLMLGCNLGDFTHAMAGSEVADQSDRKNEEPCGCPLAQAYAPEEKFAITVPEGATFFDQLSDTRVVKLENLCDKDLEIYLTTGIGRYGEFWPTKLEGDRDGAGSGELVFTLPAGATVERPMTYVLYYPEELPYESTSDTADFSANVTGEDGTTIFEAEAHLWVNIMKE